MNLKTISTWAAVLPCGLLAAVCLFAAFCGFAFAEDVPPIDPKAPVIDMDSTVKCRVGEMLALSATVKPAEGRTVTLRWTCILPKALTIPAAFATEARFRFSPRTTGTYVFQLEATDSEGKVSSKQVSISVRPKADPAHLPKMNSPAGY